MRYILKNVLSSFFEGGKVRRKYLFVVLCATLAVAGCSGATETPPNPAPPPPPTTVTETVTQPAPPPTTVTKTVTPPVETIKPVNPPPVPQPEDCSATLDGWNNGGPKGTGETYAPVTDEVVSVRVGQHACFDQVTIDINTTAMVGSHFEYVAVPTSDGSGYPPVPPVAGGAVLQGSVFAWSKDLKTSGAPYQYGPEHFKGWKALREVRYDTTHESHTSFFIGTVADNAYRMRSWQDGSVRKIIIQVAH